MLWAPLSTPFLEKIPGLLLRGIDSLRGGSLTTERCGTLYVVVH